MDIFDILKLILASFGGATVALIGLSKWLGNVWANRILEKEKAKHNIELEGYKSTLEIEGEKATLYIESQFNLYNSLWESLYTLKLAGDNLWERANVINLKKFSSQLKKTDEMINKRLLLIEDEHREELMSVMEAFKNFRIGKEKLVDLRSINSAWNNDPRAKNEIRGVIKHNREIRDQYNQLINKIRDSLRNQLRGQFTTPNNSFNRSAS